ncbi:MAG: hypothetical protein QMC80_05415 [Thermoplasmatales archaeon]|nr:hypothetical protein [Thermoplasmatales archaeon]
MMHSIGRLSEESVENNMLKIVSKVVNITKKRHVSFFIFLLISMYVKRKNRITHRKQTNTIKVTSAILIMETSIDKRRIT